MGRNGTYFLMIKIERFINQLMNSNCYIVIDSDANNCIVIDPASEKSENEIDFIDKNNLTLDYIIITHEHTDHTWGVNSLKEKYPNSKLICSNLCNKYMAKASRAYFLLYYDNPEYKYTVNPADLLIEEDSTLYWNDKTIEFLMTPGHSFGSMCIKIEGKLFTGDTIMPHTPYFNGRDSDKEEWEKSIEKISRLNILETVIYPGHGDVLMYNDWVNNYSMFN